MSPWPCCAAFTPAMGTCLSAAALGQTPSSWRTRVTTTSPNTFLSATSHCLHVLATCFLPSPCSHLFSSSYVSSRPGHVFQALYHFRSIPLFGTQPDLEAGLIRLGCTPKRGSLAFGQSGLMLQQ
ncbi:unnamed protein product [Polarella glacialis]|uniref:Secreted protein n=1 Tax=Polarella glacialis TaxID=89957 RepID=A0A813DUW9_POLGL|nr:unnamed protein product [Polarella glacialis]